MRIIKEGQKPIKEWQVTCKKCGCIFVFDDRDVHSDQREGDWVVCPTCKECITVTHRNWLNEGIKHLQGMSENKYCGNCKHFKDEDIEGFNYCEIEHGFKYCDEVCVEHEAINNGWTEITPDNVEDIKKIDVGRLSYAYQSPKGWVLYQIRMSLDFMARKGGYYYYVLPELKIE